MQSQLPPLPRPAPGFTTARVRPPLLFAALVTLSLSIYLVLLVPYRAATLLAPRWLLVTRFAAASAALAAYLADRSRSGTKPTGRSRAIFHAPYFGFAAVGICASFLLVAMGLHRDPIETSAGLLQSTAWLMTSWLALLAAGRNQAQQARQWLARSIAITITCIVLPLLPLLQHFPQLHADSAGLETGITVFAALLLTDVALNWREITTSRS